MLEIEVKIRVKDLNPYREKLLNLGAILVSERFYEENILYDFPSQTLYKKRQALRVRKIGKKAFLTFKGAPQKSRKFKIRKEYETEIKNQKQVRKILKYMGLVPVFDYQKYRTVFKKGNLKICLDETPVGNFIEMEGERNEIVRFAQALDFSKDEYIKLDYIELIKKEREKK
ncbi:MAG: class IV adenylate cyclase [Candidatus Aminicenantaceae bacterium]